jgi:glycosyltransferase involved in cell wall biosynthesis
VKILFVTPTVPWPVITGLRMRVANIIQALATVGDVDVFTIGAENLQATDIDGPTVRLGGAARPDDGPRGWLSRLTARRLSIETRNYTSLRSVFHEWARGPYDLTWFARAESYIALGAVARSPAIVDLDDLEDWRIATRLVVSSRDSSEGASPASDGDDAYSRWADRLRAQMKQHRWRTLERAIAGSVSAVTVCSEVDRERLGVANAVVIPNSYPEPSEQAGRLPVGRPPTIVFQGLFGYPPNLDGAFFLIRRILPHLRSEIPGVRVRLVGRHDERLRELASVPGVTMTGEVSSMLPELTVADVIAVPVRFGSGTRVKILEAFAHRIPVVSTRLGGEGLDVADQQHLLLRDEAEAFAVACARLLTDHALRRRLTDSAHDLYCERYRPDAVTPLVVSLAERVAKGRPSATPH